MASNSSVTTITTAKLLSEAKAINTYYTQLSFVHICLLI